MAVVATKFYMHLHNYCKTSGFLFSPDVQALNAAASEDWLAVLTGESYHLRVQPD